MQFAQQHSWWHAIACVPMWWEMEKWNKMEYIYHLAPLEWLTGDLMEIEKLCHFDCRQAASAAAVAVATFVIQKR